MPQPSTPQLDVVNPPTDPEKSTPAVALNASAGGAAPAAETPAASEHVTTATPAASRITLPSHLVRIYVSLFSAWPGRKDLPPPHPIPSDELGMHFIIGTLVQA